MAADYMDLTSKGFMILQATSKKSLTFWHAKSLGSTASSGVKGQSCGGTWLCCAVVCAGNCGGLQACSRLAAYSSDSQARRAHSKSRCSTL